MPSKRVLNAIREGLEEIESYVTFRRVLADHEEPEEPEVEVHAIENGGGEQIAEDAAGDENEDEDDTEYEEEYDGPDAFDREEVEVAIDAFISALVDAGILRKPRPGKAPSFADVFKKFFGKDHEITAKARAFEEFVKGYFGWISPEDMDNAHSEFVDIKETIDGVLKGELREQQIPG